MFLPWARLPRWAILVPTIGYLASVSLLLISGGTDPSVQSTRRRALGPCPPSGPRHGPLLPPLLLGDRPGRRHGQPHRGRCGRPEQRGDEPAPPLLWTAVSVVITVAIYGLRERLEGKVRDSAELARLGRLMNGATQSLTSLRDPKDVIVEGTEVMAELAGSECSRSVYLRVSDDVVTQEAVADDLGSTPTSYLLRDDPYVRQVLETKRPLVTEIDLTMGPSLAHVVDGGRSSPTPSGSPSPPRASCTASSAWPAGAPRSPRTSSPAAAPWPTWSSLPWPTRSPTRSSRSRPTRTP